MVRLPQAATSGHVVVPGTDTSIVSFGSCFAEHLFSALCGRYGLPGYSRLKICNHFNVESLADMLERVIRGEDLTQGVFFPSRLIDNRRPVMTSPFLRALYGRTAGQVAQQAGQLREELRAALRCADVVLLTLGMADVVRLRDDGRVLCSVNYIDRSLVEHDLLDPAGIAAALERVRTAILDLRDQRPAAFVCTISPQRYFPGALLVTEDDTLDFAHSQLSKATLKVGVETFLRQHPDVVYFPAYEIGIEELRWVEPLCRDDEFMYVRSETATYIIRRFIQAHCGPLVHALVQAVDMVEPLLVRARRYPHLQAEFAAALAEHIAQWKQAFVAPLPTALERVRNQALVLAAGD